MKHFTNLRRKRWQLLLLIWISAFYSVAQTPVVKVDFNISSRTEAEVNEPGYTAWPVGGTTGVLTKTIDNVTFTLQNGIVSNGWYKTGVQSPNYARMASDGVKTEDVELAISGLANGKHSIVTFHNTFDSPLAGEFSPMDIYLNGVLYKDNFVAPIRVLSNDLAESIYIPFEVTNGETVVIRFKSDPIATTTINPITICGFLLNMGDPKAKITMPYPADGDEHVDIDNNLLKTSWTPPVGAKSYDLYLATDKTEVENADINSSCFKGNFSTTNADFSDFNNLNNYYWRVDVVNEVGAKTKGNTMRFKKRSKAFPAAEGYGAYSIGGRGGKVVYVTNLDDDGPGSFRYAVSTETGPRTIVFNVSGIITLKSRVVVSSPYVTIAGQTAPGKGVCFRWAPIGVTGNDVIMQNIRLRLGIGETFDGMGLTGSQNSIIDHCSISWTIDEAFSSRSAKNITLQRTLISEALNAAGHVNYPAGTQHGYAASIGGDIGSFHHNLLAHCSGRNWSLAGGLDGSGYYAGRLDITNNVVYNWKNRTTDGGAKEVNFVGNYYKKRDIATMLYALNAQNENAGLGMQQYYFAGNVMPGVFDETNQDKGKTFTGSVSFNNWVATPFFPSHVTTQSAVDAYKIVLSNVGAVQPVFDEHDIRIINETLNGTTSCVGSVTKLAGLPDSETDIGGWESYPGVKRTADWDSDLDGMPNWWESVKGFNVNSSTGDFTEGNADADQNGYTNLEEYLQWMDEAHYFTNGNKLDVDLASLSRGFTNQPQFTFSDIVNGSVDLPNGSTVVSFTPTNAGLCGFTFTVTDGAGSSMSRRVGVYNGSITAVDEPFVYTYYKDRTNTVLLSVDGNTTSPLAVSDVKDDVTVELLPNPVVDVLNLQINSTINAKTEITVADVSGRVVVSEVVENLSGGYSLKFSDYAKGIYFVTLRTESWSKTIQFMKE